MFISPSETTNYLTHVINKTLKNMLPANTTAEVLELKSKIFSDVVREHFIITTKLSCRDEMKKVNKALKS